MFENFKQRGAMSSARLLCLAVACVLWVHVRQSSCIQHGCTQPSLGCIVLLAQGPGRGSAKVPQGPGRVSGVGRHMLHGSGFSGETFIALLLHCLVQMNHKRQAKFACRIRLCNLFVVAFPNQSFRAMSHRTSISLVAFYCSCCGPLAGRWVRKLERSPAPVSLIK